MTYSQQFDWTSILIQFFFKTFLGYPCFYKFKEWSIYVQFLNIASKRFEIRNLGFIIIFLQMKFCYKKGNYSYIYDTTIYCIMPIICTKHEFTKHKGCKKRFWLIELFIYFFFFIWISKICITVIEQTLGM